MKKVAIVGAGRVGAACASLMTRVYNLGYEVHLIDTSPESLDSFRVTPESAVYKHLIQDQDLEQLLTSIAPWAVICSTPFHINVRVAGVCDHIGAHYIDFTEDVRVKQAVQQLAPKNSTFILQTGLAPGLVTQIGLHLVDQLVQDGGEPFSLDLRVGALPQSGDYALTWSTAGLVNEYSQPCEAISFGALQTLNPLEGHEEHIVDCGRTVLEAFNTSGGMGDASMYKGLEFVNYKTLRYPGHLEHIKRSLVPYMQQGLQRGIDRAEQLFNFTQQDVVHVYVYATATKGNKGIERSYYRMFMPAHGLTALELTTAGTGVAMLEILETGELGTGVVYGGSVSYELLRRTKMGTLLLD